MAKKVSFSTVLIYQKENDIHDWILYDYGKRKGLKRNVIDKNGLGSKRLYYTSIVEKRELLILEIDDEDLDKHLEDIKKINRRKRMLAISCKRKNALEKVKKLFGDNNIKVLPSTRSYDERVNIVRKIISMKKIEFKTKEVERVFISNMVRSVLEWEDVFLLWDVLRYRGEVIEQEDIDEVFADTDFYRLERYIFSVIKGKVKYKNHKITSYYLDVKEYSPRWLMSKIREECLNLSLFYQAFRGGVIILPENERRLQERVMDLGWESGLRISDFNKYQQERYLDFVKEVDYKYFLGVVEILFKYTGRDANDIYGFIEEVKSLRREYVLNEEKGKAARE